MSFNLRLKPTEMNRKTALVICFLLGVFSCGGSRVVVENDEYKDFSLTNYNTFNFFEIEATNSENLNFKQNISYLEEAISKELVIRGLSKSSTNPELQINLGISIEDKVQTRTTSLATDPFLYSGQRSYRRQAKEVPVNTYREGSLRVHFVDRSSNTVVWVGTIEQVLPNKSKNISAAIEATVEEIFKELDHQKKQLN